MNKIYGSADLIAEGKNISYVLSAGIDIDTGKLYMPSLEFIKDKGFTDTEKIIDFWDNDEFIMKLHQKILIPYVNSVSGIKGKKYKKALIIKFSKETEYSQIVIISFSFESRCLSIIAIN